MFKTQQPWKLIEFLSTVFIAFVDGETFEFQIVGRNECYIKKGFFHSISISNASGLTRRNTHKKQFMNGI